ncbi:nucleotide pyrophosphohydrolase [Quadrisphaera setariae]|uniref:Nucleotide pyrophosphohydrolase n=1 Tax=Quadrisphaera setariae TaxID=2593304 RepID=A0A5C8ZBR3_9ACTN|nr:nucleotide pyrophosphohydrolase [Quadrisphaera setariae]TXR55545.1 nucleotide pyrophosphohydrolase [Quadrisphaera setariae]
MHVSELQQLLRDFSAEREWQRFNTPRNLALALVGEVGEVAELLQWLTDAEAAQIATASGDDAERLRQRAGEEVSDVLAYLLLLADSLGVDVERAFTDKLAANAEKYPVHLARGSAAKYTDL